MFKHITLTIVALVVLAGNAHAGTLGLGLNIFSPGSGEFQVILANNHTADLTSLEITIGNLANNYDFAQASSSNVSLFANPNIEVVPFGNTSGNGGLRTDAFITDFNGFNPGLQLNFNLDIDADIGGTSDPRQVFLAGNGSLTATFADGGTASFTFDDTFVPTGGPSVAVEVQPIPVPAAAYLLGAGLFGVIGLRHRT